MLCRKMKTEGLAFFSERPTHVTCGQGFTNGNGNGSGTGAGTGMGTSSGYGPDGWYLLAGVLFQRRDVQQAMQVADTTEELIKVLTAL